jgi:hypothetical protein
MLFARNKVLQGGHPLVLNNELRYRETRILQHESNGIGQTQDIFFWAHFGSPTFIESVKRTI